MHIFLIIVTETVLANDDIPWEVLKRRGHESVRKILLRYISLHYKKYYRKSRETETSYLR